VNNRILVLEDDGDIRRGLSELLGLKGYVVDSAGNGKQALEILRDSKNLPAVIVMDLMMPVMDGFEFRHAQAFDSTLWDIPVIIITAGNVSPAKIEELGASVVLMKPLVLDEFLGAVKRLTEVAR
jgi:CheY-like chemotaxis protein